MSQGLQRLRVTHLLLSPQAPLEAAPFHKESPHPGFSCPEPTRLPSRFAGPRNARQSTHKRRPGLESTTPGVPGCTVWRHVVGWRVGWGGSGGAVGWLCRSCSGCRSRASVRQSQWHRLRTVLYHYCTTTVYFVHRHRGSV